MRRTRLGKFILSFLLVVGAVVSTAVDWNETHLFNPAWHPHARFHDGLFLALLDGTTLIMLWLLWRPSREPAVAVTATTLYLLAVWTPFFYIEALIPGTSLLASADVPVLTLGSVSVPPNLAVAIVVVMLALAGWFLARDAGHDAY
jgi:hypothetical protein